MLLGKSTAVSASEFSVSYRVPSAPETIKLWLLPTFNTPTTMQPCDDPLWYPWFKCYQCKQPYYWPFLLRIYRSLVASPLMGPVMLTYFLCYDVIIHGCGSPFCFKSAYWFVTLDVPLDLGSYICIYIINKDRIRNHHHGWSDKNVNFVGSIIAALWILAMWCQGMLMTNCE